MIERENVRYVLADDAGGLKLFLLEEEPPRITLDLEAGTWERQDGQAGRIGSTILTDASDENALIPGTIVFVFDCTDTEHLDHLLQLEFSVQKQELHLVG